MNFLSEHGMLYVPVCDIVTLLEVVHISWFYLSSTCVYYMEECNEQFI